MESGVELSRLQAGKGTRQMAYSLTKNHSAASVPVNVTQVSATVRRFSVREPLATGQNRRRWSPRAAPASSPPGHLGVIGRRHLRGHDFLFALALADQSAAPWPATARIMSR